MKNLVRLILSLSLVVAFAGRARATAGNPSNVQNGPGSLTELHGPTVIDGALLVNGSITQNALGAPAAPTISNVGTAGATSYTYYCVAQDVNAVAGSIGESVPSSAGTTTTGNATLTASNYNAITCGGVRGAVSYRVLKANTTHSLGTCSAGNYGGFCTVNDQSTAAGTVYTPNTADGTGTTALATSISSGGQPASGAVAGDVTAARSATSGMLWLGTNGSNSLDFGITTGSNFTFTGGLLDVTTGGLSSGTKATGIATGDVSAARTAATGKMWFGSNGSQALDFGVTTGTVWTMGGGALTVSGGNITAGFAAAVQGNLIMSGSTAGTVTLAPNVNTTPSYTVTFPAAAGVQGSIPNFTNATGTMSFTATPTLGLAGTTTGKLLLSGVTSGAVTIQPQGAAGTFNYNLPVTAGTIGQVLESDGGGAGTGQTWGNYATVWAGGSANITASTKAFIQFGGQGATALQATEANTKGTWPMAGTAYNLQCNFATAAGATATTFVLRDAGVSTALTCSATSGNTCSDVTHTVAIAAGDLLDIDVNDAANNTNATGVTSCSFVVH